MKKAWLALVFGSALFLAACGGGDDEATDTNTGTEDTTTEDTTGTGDTATGGADAGAGEELVNANCISCHGGNLEGMGNTPSLADVGGRLSEEEIHDVIVNGRGGMPKGLLQGEDAEAAAAWLAQQK
ncbi:cytochrome c551 [Lysinibacillus sp. SGAir0095]|uniref:cytochrome c551 n=1 Tax=Lysinibacillus sp. SGAir0095 TaxID=2070463 RepID=UPI0010CCD463|nr:cytochrome c [Lysinibacillus sp. SGAir0095]QCR33634.1 cytochrome C551 [Lysinibacillus sp. SGAir0095]